MGKEASDDTLSRAQFFSFVYKKGLEAGANAVDKVVDSYKKVIEIGENEHWIELMPQTELKYLPKLYVRKSKGVLALFEEGGQVRAFLAHCPQDNLLLNFEPGKNKLICPFCQAGFDIAALNAAAQGGASLAEFQVTLNERNVMINFNVM